MLDGSQLFFCIRYQDFPEGGGDCTGAPGADYLDCVTGEVLFNMYSGWGICRQGAGDMVTFLAGPTALQADCLAHCVE